MSSFKHGFGLYLLLLVFSHSLLTNPVAYAWFGLGGFGFIPFIPSGGHVTKYDMLHGINTYRKTLNLPILEESYKASCLAMKIAYDLEDKHCEDFHDFYPLPGINSKIPNFQRSVKKCDININTTRDGIIMPVCVSKMREADLISSYTKNSQFTPYLNNSKYTTAGVGLDLHKMVLIIGTNTTFGDFSYASYLFNGASKGHCLPMMTAFLSLFVFLFI